MEKPDRRPGSLAGLALISAGAVLGLALTTPASSSPSSPVDQPRPQSQSTTEDS